MIRRWQCGKTRRPVCHVRRYQLLWLRRIFGVGCNGETRRICKRGLRYGQMMGGFIIIWG